VGFAGLRRITSWEYQITLHVGTNCQSWDGLFSLAIQDQTQFRAFGKKPEFSHTERAFVFTVSVDPGKRDKIEDQARLFAEDIILRTQLRIQQLIDGMASLPSPYALAAQDQHGNVAEH
jgi:hypothetical protein